MYAWLLIISITSISASMLMFLSQYIAITKQASLYYSVSQQQLLYLYNSFNVFYLIISPFLFPIYKKYYYQIVSGAAVLNCLGCLGRMFVGQNFEWALFMTIVVGIAHVPIITAPYGLLKLFPVSQQGYAAAVPLFLPVLGINYVIFHGMTTIIPSQDPFPSINLMSISIAVTATLATVLTLFFMNKLKKQIKQINTPQVNSADSICKAISGECSKIRTMIPYFIGWGTILGINWTYGGMFSYFLKPTNLDPSEIALVGLYANLSSVFFSNFGTWISNNVHFSNSMIIFTLNLIGFFASLFIQASVSIAYPILQNKTMLILAIIILRAGLSAFVNLSLVQLEKSGISSVLSSLIFFYIANLVNLGGNSITGLVSGRFSLTLLSLLIWVCIFIVHLKECRQQLKYERYIEEGVAMVESGNELESKVQAQEEIDNGDEQKEIVAEDD